MISSCKKNNESFPSFCMDGVPLTPESSLYILGISIHDDLNWNNHIKALAKSASRRLGVLYRAKKLFSSSQRLILYKAQVRPVMEYCSHVWSGAAASVVGILDRIQRKAIRFIDDELLTGSLQSLYHRRCVASLALFYRYYSSKCSEELASVVPLPKTYPRSTRACTFSNSFQVAACRARTAAHKSSFFPRTAGLWNSLPASVFPSSYHIDSFKRAVNKLQF